MTHICVGKLTSIGSDDGLSPGRRQTIIWINAGILLIGPLETNFSEILIAIETVSFKKKHLKMSSGKCRPQCVKQRFCSFSHWTDVTNWTQVLLSVHWGSYFCWNCQPLLHWRPSYWLLPACIVAAESSRVFSVRGRGLRYQQVFLAWSNLHFAQGQIFID